MPTHEVCVHIHGPHKPLRPRTPARNKVHRKEYQALRKAQAILPSAGCLGEPQRTRARGTDAPNACALSSSRQEPSARSGPHTEHGVRHTASL